MVSPTNNLQIHTFTLGELSTNCYIVEHKKAGEAWVIDPADAAEFICQKTLDLKLCVVKIISTHGHFDHILGANELGLIFNLPILIHPCDIFLLKRMHESAEHFLGHPVFEQSPTYIDSLRTRQIDWQGEVVEFIETPGHTPGSVCIYFSSISAIITGDTLFADGGVGRTDFSYSDGSELIKSLNILWKYPPETIIYPGHGKPSNIAIEHSLHL